MDDKEPLHDPALTPEEPLAEDQEVDDSELTPGQWLARNGPILALAIALVAFMRFYLKLDGDDFWNIAKAALGLSFVIFIHELGHFLVAKWCDVHVTTFSIGFGPALPGCSFRWGETTYKLALFPLGGYVQMVGQVDGDESSDGSEDDPRSYRNKPVWQRMAIISAGVVMNVILAIVTFVIVFQGPGKDRQAAVVAAVDSGSPAFKKGITTGAQILQIGDIKKPSFDNLMVVVMSTEHGEEVPLVYQRPSDQSPTTIEIEPIVSKGENSRPMIGIAPSSRAVLALRREVPPSLKHPVWRSSVADSAQPAFEFGDRIVATSDPEHPEQIKELPPDPRHPKGEQRDYFEFLRRMQVLAGKPVTIRVERGEKEKKSVDIVVAAAFHRTFGARMQMGEVTAVREGSPADQPEPKGVHARKQKYEGDVILKVEVTEPDGKKASWGRTEAEFRKDSTIPPLDPLRLRFDLQQWADRVARMRPGAARNRKVILYVRRHNRQPGQQYREEKLELTWDDSWRFDRVVPMSESSPWAIPELGFAYQIKTDVAYVEPDRKDTPGLLKTGDVLKKLHLFFPDETGGKKKASWAKIDPEQFAYVFWRLQQNDCLGTIGVEVERDKQVVELELTLPDDKSWAKVDRGLRLSRDWRRQRADGFLEAVALGFKDTFDSMRQVFQNLRGMITGRISVDNLGGPVTIATVAYRVAGYDFWEFVFFIGLISVNLAVINFLPIPVLDGGHMVFLIYERIRGKPASEGVRVAATYAGLALILSLMVFVLYLDISRLFKGS